MSTLIRKNFGLVEKKTTTWQTLLGFCFGAGLGELTYPPWQRGWKMEKVNLTPSLPCAEGAG